MAPDSLVCPKKAAAKIELEGEEMWCTAMIYGEFPSQCVEKVIMNSQT
jgi:hypothetical protein